MQVCVGHPSTGLVVGVRRVIDGDQDQPAHLVDLRGRQTSEEAPRQRDGGEFVVRAGVVVDRVVEREGDSLQPARLQQIQRGQPVAQVGLGVIATMRLCPPVEELCHHMFREQAPALDHARTAK